jgi:cytochrome c553
MRHLIVALAVAAALPAAALAQQGTAQAVDPQLVKKCTLCHSSQRFLTANPAQLKELVERMAQKFPDWFKDAEQQELVAKLDALLGDPKVVAGRAQWDETVARGKALFADASLGVGAKSCAGCHAPESLRNVADAYPKFDAKTGRHISLQERIDQMIVGQMGGKQLPLGDIRTVSLEAYLKSLR